MTFPTVFDNPVCGTQCDIYFVCGYSGCCVPGIINGTGRVTGYVPLIIVPDIVEQEKEEAGG